MISLISKIRNYTLNKPAFFLSEKYYLLYLMFLSCLVLKPVKIKKHILKVPNSLIHAEIYKVKKKTELWVTDGYRVSRLLKGFNHAGKRSLDRYRLSELVMGEKITTAIDVGANIGEFTIGLVNNGVSNIFCFEPDPVSFACLYNNLKDFKNIEKFSHIISDKNGTIDFYLSTKRADSSIIKPDNFDSVIKVKSVTLDEFFFNKNYIIDLLKIEAEGAEPEVIAGCIKLIKRVKFIVVDAGPERYGKKTDLKVKNILEKNGFNIKIFNNGIVHAVNKSL
jgi:FkbM family methyltransferase